MTTEVAQAVGEKIWEIYRITAELEQLFPGRHFTPDGHLVGSIGEVLAADMYNLTLLPASEENHDVITSDGKLVQIKATQCSSVGLLGNPDYLIVLQIDKSGTAKEIYNGPGEPVWNASGKVSKISQRHISISKLRTLMQTVPEESRIPCVRKTGDINVYDASAKAEPQRHRSKAKHPGNHLWSH